MMGPNPIKLTEELMLENRTPKGAVVCDLGSGQGITSAFLAQEYGFQVYACDLWSEPAENQAFFDQLGLTREQLIPVKADALSLPFEPAFFDAVVSVDSYNYFGRDPDFLGAKTAALREARRLPLLRHSLAGSRTATTTCPPSCSCPGRRSSWSICTTWPIGSI